MNRLSKVKQAQIAACLVEGNSVRGTSRLLDVTLNTVLRHVGWFGDSCQKFHDEKVRGLKTTDIETDEMWSFVYAKTRNLPATLKENLDFGDMWTWISMCKHSRLAICWHVGKHDPSDAQIHIEDLASRIPGRVQITTDQLAQYRAVIENIFGPRADYATVRKTMGPTEQSPDAKYTQPEHKETRRFSVFGKPDMEIDFYEYHRTPKPYRSHVSAPLCQSIECVF